jgi:hypothetical protein
MADLRQPADKSHLGLAASFGYLEPTDVGEIRSHIDTLKGLNPTETDLVVRLLEDPGGHQRRRAAGRHGRPWR